MRKIPNINKRISYIKILIGGIQRDDFGELSPLPMEVVEKTRRTSLKKCVRN